MIAVSFLLLMLVFRSIVVPLKAAVMNLLSIGAAYGVLVAVFQWGWGAELLGLDGPTPITSIIVVIMFPILFGLSMDYEVFLLSRIREEYDRTGDNTESVARGLAGTGRVITSAALIMVAVFLSFVASPIPSLKMLGLGLATAILIDATVVRMVLVPATMALLGKANWWLPGLARPDPAGGRARERWAGPELPAVVRRLRHCSGARASVAVCRPHRATPPPMPEWRVSHGVQEDGPRLVGRDRELSTLEEQLDSAVASGRRIVLLAGEAGLGKTALVEAFASSLAGRRTRVDFVRGLCVPMGEAGLPFTPVLGLLRAIEELHGTDRLVEWAGGGRRALGSLLPDLLQPAEPADDLQLQLFEAVTRVVQGAASVAPLVVLAEDVHWADESSRAPAPVPRAPPRRGTGAARVHVPARRGHRSSPAAAVPRRPGPAPVDRAHRSSRLGRAEVASMLSA